MQKVIITGIKTTKDEQGKTIGAEDFSLTAVVASTKSQNNLKAELADQGIAVVKVSATDLFLDKGKTDMVISELVASEISDGAIAEQVYKHIMKALDGACVFYKDKSRKSK